MKRFTETQKWDDPWFLELPMHLKLLWQWLCDKCDNAGVVDPSIKLASFHIGYQYPINTLSKFGNRLVKLPCGKFFIPKFIEFQYGTLSKDCKAHNPIFISLEKHGLKGYPKGIHTLQEEEEDKEKETEKEKEKEQEQILLLETPPSIHPTPQKTVSPEILRIGRILNQGRRATTLLSDSESKAFKACDFVEDEIQLVEAFYLFTERPNEPLHRRTGLLSLLNHWPDEVGKAQSWAKKYGIRITANKPQEPLPPGFK